MESALADALLGRVLDRRYHVRSRIAHGGMATVYLATDKRLDRQVALKVMHAELARDQEFVSRFIGEAKSVARLSHPNVVAVFDQGSDGQYLYLAMEYVPGRTLRSLLRERGAFPPEAALGIMDPILSGLAAAHTAGIVHRDVKPENVLLTADGRLKVVDFGLAQAQAATGHTREGLLIGTVAYIAPEQVTGHVTDFRTDVYAAGVVLFELLTGHQPHTAESPLQVAYKHVNSEVPPPSDWAPGLPAVVDRLVRAATSRDPQLRPADAGAFLRAVNAVQAGADPSAILAGTEPARPATPRLIGAPPTRPERFGRASNATGSYAPSGPYGPGDGNSHTMVVPGGFPRASEAPGWTGQGWNGPGWDDRSTDHGHHGSFLERWLFSRRLAYLAAALVAVVLIVFAGWYLTSGRYTPIPSVAGLSASQAQAMLTSDGFKVKIGPAQHSDTVTSGEVISSSPSGQATGGATIVLTVSSGPKMITIPPVTGHSLASAIALLRQDGLTVSSSPQNIGATGVAAGTVAGTTPAAGTSWPADKTVFVQVVAGPPVPNLVGQNVQSVQQNWAQQNSVNLVQQQVASTQPAGTIIAQSPAPGGVLTQGETITVKVSNGPPSVAVPNVQGQNINAATQALQGAGFQVSAHRVGFGKQVVFYSPTGTAPQGSTINVYYGL
ncbi:MAG TPA: Stk1 family PASTA domain-containing Ser/Thr kinase [Trebonia sp.]|nr:Stk1 family PASTA domain-containing Ser/Thr kinase [Trebonia sp.]